jgi:hypothetical protein
MCVPRRTGRKFQWRAGAAAAVPRPGPGRDRHGGPIGGPCRLRPRCVDPQLLSKQQVPFKERATCTRTLL